MTFSSRSLTTLAATAVMAIGGAGVAVACGGTKGSLDADVADQLLAKIDEIAKIFWETKKA
jgi:hypothetical protein